MSVIDLHPEDLFDKLSEGTLSEAEGDRLRAIHLCEYGAQAMAVHGALLAESRGSKNAPGMLVSLRDVTLTRDYIDDLSGTLTVDAQCQQANESSLQYTFRIEHAGVVLAEGRAAVVLRG